MDVYADRVTLSPEQTQELLSMLEREGSRRIVIAGQNVEETLIVKCAGLGYQMRVDGTTERINLPA